MNKQEIKQSGQQVFKQKLKQEVIIPLWKDILKKSIVNEEQLCAIFKDKVSINAEDIEKVVKKYPMSINPYYLSLIKKQDDAIWNQCIPDIKEIEDDFGMEDPLHEETDSPVPGLTHRYPDRVLLLVSNRCAMYCRFCTRKRKVGMPYKTMSREDILKGIEYIKEHKEIRDVLLSGGDPLLLDDSELEFIIKSIREIRHVEIIRIGTRVPCTLPQRITQELCAMLKKYHPLFINTHFNHPSEITEESSVLSIENENVNFYVYPNPYRENTTINYELKEGSKMNIEVYSINGQKIYEIFNGQQKAGNYRYDFNAKRLGFPAGTYILKIDINEKVNTFKLIELE